MKKFIVVLTGLFLFGCVNTPYINQVDLSKTDFSKIEELKHGDSCSTVALFFLPIETEQSILKAASEANISKVHYVESSNVGLWPLWYQNCIEVYGE